jgi:hypothetical protein
MSEYSDRQKQTHSNKDRNHSSATGNSTSSNAPRSTSRASSSAGQLQQFVTSSLFIWECRLLDLDQLPLKRQTCHLVKQREHEIGYTINKSVIRVLLNRNQLQLHGKIGRLLCLKLK